MNTKDCECMSEMTGTIVASPIVLPSVMLFILRFGWVVRNDQSVGRK